MVNVKRITSNISRIYLHEFKIALKVNAIYDSPFRGSGGRTKLRLTDKRITIHVYATALFRSSVSFSRLTGLVM